MKIETLVKIAQMAMNRKGANLIVDGNWGPETAAAANKCEIKIEAVLDHIPSEKSENNYWNLDNRGFNN